MEGVWYSFLWVVDLVLICKGVLQILVWAKLRMRLVCGFDVGLVASAVIGVVIVFAFMIVVFV